MNKSDVIRLVAEETGVTRTQATAVINSFIDAVENSLLTDDTLRLSDFGTFYLAQGEIHTRRNPQTGEIVGIPKRKILKFRPASSFKETIDTAKIRKPGRR